MRVLIPNVTLLLLAGSVRADEGMWTFDNFPSSKVRQRYGFEPEPAWLDHVRLSTVRIAGGCSASFVSPTGLLMTAHHCVLSCLEELSTAERHLLADGFYASAAGDERQCPAMEVHQLLEMTDITDRIQTATAGKSGRDFARAEQQAMSDAEQSCANNPKLHCDVVTFYDGGKYLLYRYRRFRDVRLVFVPEFSIAFFGGDSDNFEFPRYDLDVSFLRVYDEGRPVKVDHWLRWSAGGAKERELVFVAGDPGHTSRLFTVSQLDFIRDVSAPVLQRYFSELREVLKEFGTKGGPAQQRIRQSEIFGLENNLKAWKGRQASLVDPAFMAAKRAAEQDFRAKIAAAASEEDTPNATGSAPAAKRAFYVRSAGSFEAIAKALAEYRTFYVRNLLLDGAGFSGVLFNIARLLVRLGEETSKPNGERLREFTDAQLPAIESQLASTAPIHPELEIEMLTFSLNKLSALLGSDDALVKKVLGGRSPRQLATEVVTGTKLSDAKVRLALKAGGPSALAASTDPMIALARLVEPDARAMRQRYEQNVEAVVTRESAKLARAYFALGGFSTYPDATFSPRLSYGAITGWTEPDGIGAARTVPAFTNFAGAFEHATGVAPFELPKSWLAARSGLDLETPLDQVSDNDIIGGNSGSPLLNQKAEVVGLVFDGNSASLGGDYFFNALTNRAVSVHSSALLQALDRIYGAKRLLDEIASANGTPTVGRSQ